MRPDRPRFPAKIPSSVQPVSQSDAALARRRASVPAIPSGVGLDSMAVRVRMVQRLAVGGIVSKAVLQAMGRVDRHHFVDSALANQAYEDTSLPIGLGQTISKPSVVARMAELLLSLLAREVYPRERLRGLHEKARDNLRPLRLTNVHLLLGDGILGYARGAPYAGIVAAAGGNSLPQAWCEQLAVGGRLVAPVSGADGQQMLLVIDKTSHGLKESVLEPVHFVPLKSGIA